MKNFLSLLCILSLCFGCDKAYDLNKIESGDVTIGNDQSEWIMPLAQITVGMDELQDGSADIRAIFDEVDIWLPTTLPGNAEWVDIVRLSSDGTYLDGMLEALIDEMLVPGSKKMDEVVDLIWSNEGYRERFTALIPADSEELFKAEFKKFFGEDNEAGEALRDTMGELAREFLSQIKINTITYNATLDVDDDLIDMLADNLDPEGTVDPVNTLDLYGEVRSSLPVSFEVAADFSETNVAIAPFLVEPDEENDIDHILHSDGTGAPHLYMKAGGSRYPASEETIRNNWHTITQDGQAVFKAAVSNMADVSVEMMERYNLTSDDIRYLVPHQANLRIIDATANRMGLTRNKCMINIDRYGNTTAATIPLCLYDYEKELKRGDKLILASFGGGYTWGSVYVKWAYDGESAK